MIGNGRRHRPVRHADTRARARRRRRFAVSALGEIRAPMIAPLGEYMLLVVDNLADDNMLGLHELRRRAPAASILPG